MGALAIWRFLNHHPFTRRHPVRAAGRVLRWQIGSRLLPGPALVPFVDGSTLVATAGMTGATGNVYCGLHEFEDMGFVLHLLRPGDLFVDVGANIGSYTIMAAARGARVVCFEPGSETRVHLQRNVRVNDMDHSVQVIGAAVGGEVGELRLTVGGDTVNHVVSEGGEVVPVTTLDVSLEGESPVVMKVDVEGFETEVVNGATDLLTRRAPLAIVMELNGSGDRYGYDEVHLTSRLRGYGYVCCRYDPFSRRLDETETGVAHGNTIFVRDVIEARARLESASPFSVLGESI